MTLVNVWGSWCVPCREEQPLLMQLSRDDRFVLAGFNYKDKPENARRFLGELGNPFDEIGVDPSGREAIDWGVYGVPETFLVGKDGKHPLQACRAVHARLRRQGADARGREGAGVPILKFVSSDINLRSNFRIEKTLATS